MCHTFPKSEVLWPLFHHYSGYKVRRTMCPQRSWNSTLSAPQYFGLECHNVPNSESSWPSCLHNSCGGEIGREKNNYTMCSYYMDCSFERASIFWPGTPQTFKLWIPILPSPSCGRVINNNNTVYSDAMLVSRSHPRVPSLCDNGLDIVKHKLLPVLTLIPLTSMGFI